MSVLSVLYRNILCVCVCVHCVCLRACMCVCMRICNPRNRYALCLIVRYMQVLPRTVRVETVGNTVCMLLLFLVMLHVWLLCVYMCMDLSLIHI